MAQLTKVNWANAYYSIEINIMKRNLLPLLIVMLAFSLTATAQLDDAHQKELNDLKSKSKLNKTTFLIYDTVFYAGLPYCLMKTRRVSKQGDEFVLKNLEGKDIIYIIEPAKIDRTLGKLSSDNFYDFSLLTVQQKMYIPSKSIGNIPDFITSNKLIVDNKININAVNNLRLIHNDINTQKYDAASTGDDNTVKNTEPVLSDSAKEALKKYLPVVRNRSARLKAKSNVIRQNGKRIGYYEKRNRRIDGKKVTLFVFYLPNKVKIAEAINGGVASVTYKVELFPSGKIHTTSTGVFNPAQDLAEYLVKYGVL